MYLLKLKKKLVQLQNELEELHWAEPSIEMYKQRRFDLEVQIDNVEEQIKYETSLLPFKITIVGFCVFCVLALIYRIL